MTEKRCPRCGETKPLTDYHPNRASKDGVQTYCRVCLLAYRKERYDADPAKVIAEVQRWKQANPEKVRAMSRTYEAKRRAARQAERENRVSGDA